MALRSQVRKDLLKHSDDKLYKWVTDTVALYQMADIPTGDCLEDMYMSLFAAMGALSAAYDIEPECLVQTFRKTLEICKRKHDEKESRS
jgi:hypothetical protein